MSEPTHDPDPGALTEPTAFQPGYSPPPPAPKRSLRWLWITLPILLVLCLGCGGGFLVLFNRTQEANKEKMDALTRPLFPTPFVTAESPSDAPSPTPTIKGTLTLPARVAGRSKLADARLATTAKDLFTYTGTGGGKEFSGVYGRKNKDVLLIKMMEQQGQLTFSIGDLSRVLEKDNSGLQLGATSPGPRGGEAVCGAIPDLAAKVVICAWADSHSIGTAVFFFKTLTVAQKEFVTVRNQVDLHS